MKHDPDKVIKSEENVKTDPDQKLETGQRQDETLDEFKERYLALNNTPLCFMVYVNYPYIKGPIGWPKGPEWELEKRVFLC